MKMSGVVFLFFILSCTDSSIKLEPYSSSLLENKKYQDKSYDFTSEYQIVKWYKNQNDIEIKQFFYRNDGHLIKGYALLPKNIEDKKYPTIIHLRGGWGSYKKPGLFLFRWLSKFVERGYVVISSDLRGANYAEKRFDEFGGDDFRDVKKLFSLAINFPFVDEKNIQTISWGSRGGVMSYLALKSDINFKSSVIINGASDLFLLEKTRPYNFFQSIIKGVKEIAFKKRSGVYWAEQIKKPVLILHGENDRNTSVAHALVMAEKLKQAKKSYKLKVYKGSGHDLSGEDHVEQSIMWFQSQK